MSVKHGFVHPGERPFNFIRVCPACLLGFFIIFGIFEMAAGDTTAVLTWTAPGDNGNAGRAYIYDLRYSTNSPGENLQAWWQSAIPAVGEPSPSPAGQTETYNLTGLSENEVYYFLIRTADSSLNWSGFSNIAVFPNLTCGDVNGDENLNVLDITYLICYFYHDGPPPVPPSTGDVNGDGYLNPLDIVHLIRFFYKSGMPPQCDK